MNHSPFAMQDKYFYKGRWFVKASMAFFVGAIYESSLQNSNFETE